MGIVLTEKAASEVKRIIADQKIEPEMVLRVGVTGGGCSGFSYALGFDKTYDEKADSEVRIPRRAGRRRQEKRPLPRWHDDRLLRRPRSPRLQVRQPERRENLRLRQLVPSLRRTRAEETRVESPDIMSGFFLFPALDHRPSSPRHPAHNRYNQPCDFIHEFAFAFPAAKLGFQQGDSPFGALRHSGS